MSAERPVPDAGGEGIIAWSWRGTALFTVTAVAAAISPDLFRWPALVAALGLFAVGCVVFVWAFLIAVQRSRVDAIGIGGLYFLAGSAPRPVQRSLLGSFAVEVVVAVVTASVRVFTSLAFGILVPVFGLAMAGLWGARQGVFAPREE